MVAVALLARFGLEMMLARVQGMLDAADRLAAASPRTVVFDKKRKAELAAKLAQRWQRWELSNFDYLMQVTCAPTLCPPSCTYRTTMQLPPGSPVTCTVICATAT